VQLLCTKITSFHVATFGSRLWQNARISPLVMALKFFPVYTNNISCKELLIMRTKGQASTRQLRSMLMMYETQHD
jgi:hypothetical protein